MANRNPAQIDRKDERRMLPCRYFVAGLCRKGSRCRLLHPMLNSWERFIQVPDLPPGFQHVHGVRQGGYVGEKKGIPQLIAGPAPGSMLEIGGTSLSANAAPFVPISHSKTLEMPGNTKSPATIKYETSGDVKDVKNRNVFNTSKPVQNTVFNYIDWAEYLLPGTEPPPPTEVPDNIAL